MVGDVLDDIEAGHRAGCRSVLLDIGAEREWLDDPLRQPDAVALDWAAVADTIVSMPISSASGEDLRWG